MPFALLAGCGGDSGAGGPSTVDLPGPQGQGALVAKSSGCLGCHRIGDNGNDGPGPDLTHVGSRLPRAAVARVLVSPTAPMPSYARMPGDQRAALVSYLAQLR